MLDGMSDSIQRSRIENLHSREVDHQSPTGLILLMLVFISYFTALTLDFQDGSCLPSRILKFLPYLSKIQIIAYFYVDMQNLEKIGRSLAKLLCFSIIKMAAVRHLGF